jgi:hypothetical protein
MKDEHEFWVERMSTFLDGELSSREAQAVEEHLRECAGCRSVRDELEEVRRRARALRELEPERDLWPQIEERLGEDPLVEKVIPLKAGWRASRPLEHGRRRLAVTLPQVAAAALVLVAGGWLAGSGLAPRGAAEGGVAPVEGVARLASDLPGVPGTLSQELATLERHVLGRLDTLSPETRSTLLRNLEVIDRAIRESLDALSQEPGSAYLRGHLGAALERKRGYLERMSTLLEA